MSGGSGQVLRWGVVSTGRIAHDFVKALQLLPRDRHVVAVVAARREEDAAEFAAKFGIPRAYGGYERLAQDPDIDVVYVAAINHVHYDVTKMMLEHDKHVLCEKPFMMTLHQTKHILRLAQEKKRFCMEGVWSRFFPVYARVRGAVASGEIGDVVLVKADFGKHVKGQERYMTREFGGGGMMYFGIYCLQLAIMLYDEYPEHMAVTGSLYDTGVDRGCAGSARYSGGRLLQFCSHTEALLPNKAVIVGSKGSIEIPEPFWCPDAVVVNGRREEHPVPGGRNIFSNTGGFVYEADAVRDAIIRGDLQHELHPWHHTEILAAMLDECRRQLNYRFDCETPASS